MSEVGELLRSKWRALEIHLQRWVDHTWRRLLGVPQYRRSMITPQLYLGGQYTRRGLDRLRGWGITAVVNMRSREAFPLQEYPWVRYLHLPTEDQQAPLLEHLFRGVEFMRQEIEKGGKVYVHCLHGEGRGPTMSMAYLISTGLTLEDALRVVREGRSFVRPTLVQLARLREFEALVREEEDRSHR